EFRQHLRGRRAIVGTGGRHRYRQQQPQRVHDDVTLAARDLLVAVVAAGAADLGALDRLGVDAAGAGGRVTPRLHTDRFAHRVEDRLPGAVVPPAGEVVVDGTLGQQVVR